MRESDYWEKLKKSEWKNLAKWWLSEIRGEASMQVTMMNFTARPQLQWEFILLAVSLAESDEELGHIAAGPIEHLLGSHGEQFINLAEGEAEKNPKFARTLTGVWKYKIPDEIWARLKSLTAKVKDTLQTPDGTDEAHHKSDPGS